MPAFKTILAWTHGLPLIRRRCELRRNAKAEELMEALIMFDFEGTLADTLGVFIEYFDALANSFGFRRFDREQIDYLRTCEAMEILHYHGIHLSEARPVIAALCNEMGKRSERIKLFGRHSFPVESAHGRKKGNGADYIQLGRTLDLDARSGSTEDFPILLVRRGYLSKSGCYPGCLGAKRYL